MLATRNTSERCSVRAQAPHADRCLVASHVLQHNRAMPMHNSGKTTHQSDFAPRVGVWLLDVNHALPPALFTS